MKTIQSLTVTAVVLMFTLSVFAVPAAAAHDPKDPHHDNLWPDSVFDGDRNENWPDSVFDGDRNENWPDSVFDGDRNENWPDSVFDGDELFPGDQFSPGDKVIVTDSENMDKHAKKGVMPGENVQLPDSFFDEPGDLEDPEGRWGFQDGSDPVLVSP